MRPIATALAAAAISAVCCPSAFSQSIPIHSNVLPQPSALHFTSSSNIAITPAFSAQITHTSDALQAAVDRAMFRLQNQTGIQFQSRLAQGSQAGTLVVKVDDTSTILPYLGMDESYTLQSDGKTITLQAKTVFGAYRALETFLQMVQPTATGFVIPAFQIEDSPRFVWRGLMLDTGRHFLPTAAILRTLDGMASVKLNVLHFHLSEDQGFRMESKTFPRLHELGSNGNYYTQDEIRQIIAYATARGIRVVPEFDMPGHSSSWLVGYPELGSSSDPARVEKGFGVLDAALDPTRESTYEFLDKFFAEMASIFPDQYFHVGGDESNGRQWSHNPKILAFMKEHKIATTEALQVYFNQRIEALLEKHGKKMVGWDEIQRPGLASEVVVQVWHTAKFLNDGAKEGHHEIYSAPYYLDHARNAAEMYLSDPIPSDSPLNAEEQKKILGGEAAMWAEQVTDASIDSHIWPRAAAVAERFWSPQSVRDVNDMYRRLNLESLRLDALGVQNISGPQRMVRQWYGGMPSPAVLALTETLQPVDFGRRANYQHNTVDTPMTSLADSVGFEPPMHYQFAELMDHYLQGDQEANTKLQTLFQSWIDAVPALDKEAATHPRLNEVKTRRKQLGQLGTLGLQLLKAHNSGTKLSAADTTTAKTELTDISKPNPELVDFVVTAPLLKLLSSVQ